MGSSARLRDLAIVRDNLQSQSQGAESSKGFVSQAFDFMACRWADENISAASADGYDEF